MTQYTYRAEWSPERGRYLAGCLEFPRLWATGMTAATAIAAMEQTVADEVRDLLASEMSPPESITDRKYSGKFLLRMPTAMHAKLSVEAAERRQRDRRLDDLVQVELGGILVLALR